MRTNVTLGPANGWGHKGAKSRLVGCVSAAVTACILGVLFLLGPTPQLGLAAPQRQYVPDLAVKKYLDSGVFAPGQYVKYVIVADARTFSVQKVAQRTR